MLELDSKPQIMCEGKGVQRIESGAYTPVREHFNSMDNAAFGH